MDGREALSRLVIVALAAIQALYELGKEKDRRIEALEARLARLEGSTD